MDKVSKVGSTMTELFGPSWRTALVVGVAVWLLMEVAVTPIRQKAALLERLQDIYASCELSAPATFVWPNPKCASEAGMAVARSRQ